MNSRGQRCGIVIPSDLFATSLTTDIHNASARGAEISKAERMRLRHQLPPTS